MVLVAVAIAIVGVVVLDGGTFAQDAVFILNRQQPISNQPPHASSHLKKWSPRPLAVRRPSPKEQISSSAVV
jgi:hypothetical protein